jgi:hypothetical protein
MELAPLGRVLVVVGLIVVALGLVLAFGEHIPLVGRLPGDLTFRGDGWTVYAPIATSLILSVLLTAVLSLVAWLGRR